jgi:hypothetical protein
MSDPRPTQVSAPGTDFLVYATGAGANVESMPAYQSDAQRDTGNLPGIARSSFNNRVQRQGAFVATAISTFVWEVLSIYVPDDGDLDNYVANFKAALRAYITPEGALPGGPYLPTAGGTMLGNIDFNPGATIVLPNNTWLRAKDTGGTSHGMLRIGTDNNHYIGDGSSPYIIFGSTPMVGSGIFWSARDSGGTAHGLLGIQADNNTYLTAFNALYVNSNNMWVNSNIIIPNGNIYYTKNAAGAPIAMLYTRSDNITLIAAGAPLDTYIYSGRNLYLNGPVFATGVFNAQSAVAISGALDVYGTMTARGSFSANGAANFYARLNVNNSVGATITGDISTNSVRIYGGGITADGTNSLGGTTYITYTRVYNPGNSDPLEVYADPGRYARARFHVGGVRIWSAGTDTGGQFAIADENAGAYRLYIDTAGTVIVPNALNVGGGVTVSGSIYTPQTITSNVSYTNAWLCYGNATTRGAHYLGAEGYYINYIGSAFIYVNGHFRVQGQLECYGNFVCSNTAYMSGETHSAGSFVTSSHVFASGEAHINQRVYAGDVFSYGGVFISGDGGFYLISDGNHKWLNYDPWHYFYYQSDRDVWVAHPGVSHLQVQFGYEWYFKNWQGPMYARGFGAQGLRHVDIQMQTTRSVERAMDVIAALKPIHFKRVPRLRQSATSEHPYYLDGEERDEIGFLAEEIREVLPQAVVDTPPMSDAVRNRKPPVPDGMDHTENDEDHSPYAVYSDVILAVAVKAIQEMNVRLAQLEERFGTA